MFDSDAIRYDKENLLKTSQAAEGIATFLLLAYNVPIFVIQNSLF